MVCAASEWLNECGMETGRERAFVRERERDVKLGMGGDVDFRQHRIF